MPAQTSAVTPGIPPDVQRVFAQTRDPMLILPIDQLSEFDYMLWSTDGFPLIANGNSGNFLPQYQEILAATQSFPDSHSIAVLDKYGIHKVVLLKVAAATTPYAAVSARKPRAGFIRHAAWERWLWRRWFAHDGVRLSPEHLETLTDAMPDHVRLERQGALPYLPGLNVPYYLFIGRKAGGSAAPP